MGEPPRVAGEAAPDSKQSFRLVMAVHPKCPCTAASVYELERLLVRAQGRLECHVLEYEPEDEAPGWSRGDPFGLKTRYPGITVQPDPGGHAAAALGCHVSGSVVLFDADGAARFWGGITSGRGHAGDNLGSDSVVAIVTGRVPPRRTTPVFGCDLGNHRSAAETEGANHD